MTSKLLGRLLAVLTVVAASPLTAQVTLGSGPLGADWSNIPTAYPTGAAPADAVEPADIPPQGFDPNQWITTGDGLTNSRSVPGTFYVNPSDPFAERKGRFQCEPSDVVLTQDFVLRNMAHLHAPFGLVKWDQNSTFATARAHPSSTCMGGPLLSQIYIEPAMEDILPNGAIVVRRAQTHTVYYVGKAQSAPHDETWVRRDMQFIIGPNPNNYNDQARRDIYAAAGFTYPGSPDTPAGTLGWTCETGPNQSQGATVTYLPARMKTPEGIEDSTRARYLVGPHGEDVFGGGCVAYSPTVKASLLLNLIAPKCWNPHYLKTDDGRKHMWYSASNTDSSKQDACPSLPNGEPYMRVPDPQFKSQWFVKDFNDFKNMHFSSDRMNPVNTPGDPSSKSPCRQIGPWFCNGETGHADWGYGAESSTFDEMQRECLGITVRGIAPVYPGGAECNFGQISRYRAFLTGPSPNPALSGGCLVILSCTDATPGKPKELYFTPPKQASGMVHIRRK